MHVVHGSDAVPRVWDGRLQILGAACEPRQDTPRVLAWPRSPPIRPAITGQIWAEELHALGDGDAEQVGAGQQDPQGQGGQGQPAGADDRVVSLQTGQCS
jgi:hypothetical protein